MHASSPVVSTSLQLPSVHDNDDRGLVVPIGILASGEKLVVVEVAVITPHQQPMTYVISKDIYNGLAGWYAARGRGIRIWNSDFELIGAVANDYEVSTEIERRAFVLLDEPSFSTVNATWNRQNVEATVMSIVVRLSRPLCPGDMVRVQFYGMTTYGDWFIFDERMEFCAKEAKPSVELCPPNADPGL